MSCRFTSQLSNHSRILVIKCLLPDNTAVYTPPKSLTTLDGEIVDPEIAVKLEMWDLLKVHGAQTKHLHHLIQQMQ